MTVAVRWCNSVAQTKNGWGSLVISRYDLIAICTSNSGISPTYAVCTLSANEYILKAELWLNWKGIKGAKRAPKFIAHVRFFSTMASQNLHLRLTVAIVLLVNAISTVSSQCPQDKTQSGDIICTVNRNAFLPSPAVALVHCETDQPGELLLKQADALEVANTRWRVDQKACFLRQGESCTHLFIRIDSPPSQQQIDVCRIQFPTVVCMCIDLTGKSRSQICTTIYTLLPSLILYTKLWSMCLIVEKIEA